MVLIILNAIFCISFLVFAYFNLNDPDAWLWVPIYVYAAILCGLVIFGISYTWTFWLGIAFYSVYALFLFFAKDGVQDWFLKYRRPSLVQSMQASKPYIEKTREFFGLLIVDAGLILNLILIG